MLQPARPAMRALPGVAQPRAMKWEAPRSRGLSAFWRLRYAPVLLHGGLVALLTALWLLSDDAAFTLRVGGVLSTVVFLALAASSGAQAAARSKAIASNSTWTPSSRPEIKSTRG